MANSEVDSPTPADSGAWEAGADSREARRTVAGILQFARERLGPASEELLSDPARQTLVLARMRNDVDLEDAVLREVHGAAAARGRVADEFVAFFLNDLLRVGHRLQTAEMRRFLDTGDLVQSMLGDVWPDLHAVRFETRGKFLTYLGQRLRWKMSDRSRGMNSGRRREDLRTDVDPGELRAASEDPSPGTVAEMGEEHERMVLALLRLSERDRELLVMYLGGRSLTEMAEQAGLSYDAARMALQRAMRRARRLQ